MNYLAFVKKYAVLPALFISGCLEASSPTNLGLIGGEVGPSAGPAYAALVSQTRAVTPLNLAPGFPGNSGTIVSVAMNSSGRGLIGGQDISSFAAYAALTSPAGAVTPLDLEPGFSSGNSGVIFSAAMNSSGLGLIGGLDLNSLAAYAALVSPAGTVTHLSLAGISATSIIVSVAMNNSGQGLIGGENFFIFGPPYAAFVSPAGNVTQLTLPGTFFFGTIFSVAINSSGRGLIGGGQFSFTGPAFAALISPSGAVMQLTLPGISPSLGVINSVAINDSGQGLIGGEDSPSVPGPAYAALVSPSGAVTPLTLPGISTSSGVISSVAINSCGQGLIGGKDSPGSNGPAYAALVSPTGAVTPLPLGIPTGSINSVAINDFNQGLIGGQNGLAAYAALVSPTGQVIPLNIGLSNGIIRSVVLLSLVPTSGLSGNNLDFAKYINKNAPYDAFYLAPAFCDGTLAQALESAAPTRNAFSLFTADNNLFYLDSLLSNHSSSARNARRQALQPVPAQTRRQNLQFASTLDIPTNELLAWSSTSYRNQPPPPPKEHPFELWGTFLGALAYQKKQHQTPAFNPTTGGAIFAFDGKVSTHARVGTGAAYTYTYIHEKQDAGHSRINQEYLFLYTTWDNTRWYFDTALMGGLFQIDNVRKIHMTAFEFQSKSKPKGWQLAPHLEVGYDYNFYDRKFTAEPFVMFDWVSNWQGSYKEHGSGPFNAGQKRHYSSFLRSETGLRFYETARYDSWNFTVEEKLSYVNKKPFKVGRVNAFLVGAPGSFTVETLTTTQNLGVGQLEFIFEPHKRSLPTTTLEYQGEFGSMYQSHLVSLELTWNF